MNILLLGAPGSGKGTQGVRIAEELGVRHIAAGDLLRAELKSGSALGKQMSDLMSRGELVPDVSVFVLVLPEVVRAAAAGGYVLDGFPRSIGQVELTRDLAADAGAAPDAVICLDVPEDELVRRILARAETEGRVDDTAEVIANRLRIYNEITEPLIAHYTERGLLRRINAVGTTEEVTALVLQELKKAS